MSMYGDKRFCLTCKYSINGEPFACDGSTCEVCINNGLIENRWEEKEETNEETTS